MIDNKKTVFDVKTHLEYLHECLRPQPNGRGLKKRLAEYLNIQPAFLSQILSGRYDLTLEQADATNLFFDHSPDESDFFILLVNRDRASTPSLRKYFDVKVQNVLRKRLEFVERVGKKHEVSQEAQNIYYSSWIYAAIHIGSAIPEFCTQTGIAKALGLPLDLTGKTLDFLVANRLLKKDGNRYEITDHWIRIERASPHIIKHHSHWRAKAIQNLELQNEEELHFSGVYAIDKKAMLKIKDQTLTFIKQQMRDIEPATEERLVVFNIDWFSLTKSDPG